MNHYRFDDLNNVYSDELYFDFPDNILPENPVFEFFFVESSLLFFVSFLHHISHNFFKKNLILVILNDINILVGCMAYFDDFLDLLYFINLLYSL